MQVRNPNKPRRLATGPMKLPTRRTVAVGAGTSLRCTDGPLAGNSVHLRTASTLPFSVNGKLGCYVATNGDRAVWDESMTWGKVAA